MRRTLPVRVAAEVKDFDTDRLHFDQGPPARFDGRCIFSRRRKLTFADVVLIPLTRSRCEAQIGDCAWEAAARASVSSKSSSVIYFTNEARKGSVYTIPTATPGSLPSEVSMAFGLRGFSHLVSTGCTSSTDAIAYAAQMIALGRIDTILTGGVDAPFAHSIMLGFCVMKVMT